jgi:hypothetical protein
MTILIDESHAVMDTLTFWATPHCKTFDFSYRAGAWRTRLDVQPTKWVLRWFDADTDTIQQREIIVLFEPT